MAILWIDIETLPSAEKPPCETISVPGNYTKPDSIKKYQEENLERVWREQALSSLEGRICCIAWAEGNSPAVCRGIWSKTEFEILAELDKVAQSMAAQDDSVTWGGFNLQGFDLNWIWQRAVKYDLAALVDYIPRRKYHPHIVDVRHVWTGGDDRRKGRLKDIAKWLGIETIDGMDGGEVFDRYMAGEFELIEKYCKHDVDITRNIAWRMGLTSRPVVMKGA